MSNQPVKIKDAASYEFAWRNNGKLLDGSQVTLKDALSTSNAPMFMPKTISNIVKEAQEPLLVGTSLLQRIQYSYGQTITFGAVGALQAADIPEGGEYPERSPQTGGATVTATIGKSGLALKVTEEMIRYSQFDVVGLMLRAAGRALARHKEVKIFNLVRALGVRVFDNVTPAASLRGVTTGRDLHGTGNGSVTMDDIFDCYAQILTQGFTPNTLLMHPLTWTMWVKDPTLRAFALMNGGGTYFATWKGSGAGRAPWDGSGQGGLGYSSGQLIMPPEALATAGEQPSLLNEYSQILSSAPVLPSYMNIPFTIIVSPFVPYDPRKKLSDIYMFDRSELGALIVDHDVVMDEFDDPRADLTKIKLKERYALAILNEGKACAVMRNIHVVPNEVVLPAQAHIDVSGSLSPINALDPVLLG